MTADRQQQSTAARPRIGLLCGELDGTGGLYVSQRRHVQLMSDEAELIVLSLTPSSNEMHAVGHVEKRDLEGTVHYTIRCSRLVTDDFLEGAKNNMRNHCLAEIVGDVARAEKLDALHLFGAYDDNAMIAAYAAARAQLPLILTFRGSDLGPKVFGSSLAGIERAVANAAACVCLNADAAQLLQQLFGPRGPIHVIPNHIDPAPYRTPNRPAVPFPPGPTIGMVAEFRRITGVDTLLQAFGRLSSERELNLCLIGPWRRAESVYYSELLAHHPHAARIVRPGRVKHSEIADWLHACDLLVFPSLWEGSPNKVLEAMASRRPIVATRVPGITDTIEHGREGLLVAPRDPSALATAIAQQLDDPARARAMAERAYERIKTEFCSERERSNWRRLFSQVFDAPTNP